MRQFNRILGFVAVSFVLVFLGKVNKVGLYTVYFKTLADVEIRNSTAHDHGDTQYAIVDAARGQQQLVQHAAGSATMLGSGIDLSVHIPNHAITSAAPAAESFGLRCFMEVAPRAPGA
jgi:hypothetical protein